MPRHDDHPAAGETAGPSLETLRQWIGRSQVEHDTVTETPVRLLASTLDRPQAPAAGEALPCLWHWLYFLPAARQSELGPDGHAPRGDFVPPVPLPRRMWAGSNLELRLPIRIGDAITRRATIAAVDEKTGRSGRLVFVRIVHTVECPRGPAVSEERILVFRESRPTGAAEPKPAPHDAQWSRRVVADSALLFRYSALTFNAHRIHYDRPYATEVEGYRDLIVTGPLLATLLVELVATRLPEHRIERLSIRATSPLFAGEPCTIAGRQDGDVVHLWASNPGDALAMTARAEVARWT